jgi:mannose/fructose-specific phosphotransferase system component IIA
MSQYKTIVAGYDMFASDFEGAFKLLTGKQLNMKFIDLKKI